MSQEDSEYWSRYYEVTVDRPAWETVRKAIELFQVEDRALADTAGRAQAAIHGQAAHHAPAPALATPSAPRFAVDLGCGAGRDARELLRAGWQVLAVDREPAAAEVLRKAAGPELAGRLSVHTEDLATFAPPPCDLVNASLCLPFLPNDAYAGIWSRIVAAVRPGGRFAAMLFGDRDDSAGEEGTTCLPPDRIRADLAGFEIEHWTDKEEDTKTALGEPHHFHLVEFVARKAR
jgi:tellurite methyltransferase